MLMEGIQKQQQKRKSREKGAVFAPTTVGRMDRNTTTEENTKTINLLAKNKSN